MTHPFERDPDIPVDYEGRTYCRCGLPGHDGDGRHGRQLELPPALLRSFAEPIHPQGDDAE